MYYDLKYSLEEVAYASNIHILSNLTYAMVLCEEFSVHCVFFWSTLVIVLCSYHWQETRQIMFVNKTRVIFLFYEISFSPTVQKWPTAHRII